MNAYATREDLYTYGLPRGSLGAQARLVASSLASTDTLELDQHGFETGAALLLRAVEGGTLSAPLAEGTTYYAIRVSSSQFKLAASSALATAGTAINLTSDGVTMLATCELPIDQTLERYSRFADGFVPAHAVPLTAPYPVEVVAVVAELAARRLQLLSGTTSIVMAEIEAGAAKQLERWAKGIPVRGVEPTRRTNLAVRGAATSTRSDPRGWGSSLP